jgi:MFS family permease
VRLLWGAAVVSDIGTWVQLIVVGSLVAATTGSAVKTGLVALATFMPQGLASPVGGLLADRYERRRVFASALMLQALMTGVLATALGLGVRNPYVLTGIILLGSASGALGAPSYAAMQPDLVPADELMAMVSLGVYSWNSGRIIGPLLGTLLVITVGPSWTIAFNAVTFLAMATAVSLLRRTFEPHGSDGTVRERLAGGWQALRGTPGCWHAVVLLVLFNLTVVPFMGLIPIFARAEFGGGTGLAGVISSAQGIGAIIGGIAITMLAVRRRRSELLVGIVTLVSISLVGYAMAPTAVAVAGAAAVLGAGGASLFITSASILQRDAPLQSRGRVMAMMQACMGVSYGIGIMTIGSIGDAIGLRAAFAIGAAGLALGFWALTVRSTRWRAAVDDDQLLVERRLELAH